MSNLLATLKTALGVTSGYTDFIKSISRVLDIEKYKSGKALVGKFIIDDYNLPPEVIRQIIDFRFMSIENRRVRMNGAKSAKTREVFRYSIENFPTKESLYAVFCNGRSEEDIKSDISSTDIVDDVFGSLKKDLEKDTIEEPTIEELTPPTSEEEKLREELEDVKKRFTDFENYAKKAIGFMNAVSVSEDCTNITTFHRILKQNGVEISEKDFFEWLRNGGYIKNSIDGYERNIPTEWAVTNGFLNVREVVVNGSGSKPHITFTPKITGKGQIHLLNCFNIRQEDLKYDNG